MYQWLNLFIMSNEKDYSVTKCVKAGIVESFPRQRREAFPL
jgi:hypothetical protein